ncbi:MAG: hypothetical protein KAJ29_05570 [Alphaproteobacteria bacterium]|nr:hypothetical protein [Alphaproteobacteria bacterium]
MKKTKVKELIIMHPAFINPADSLRNTAERMKGIECSILPLNTKKIDNIQGIIADRDRLN